MRALTGRKKFKTCIIKGQILKDISSGGQKSK